eukprot:10504782-Alexandrium_andersonii.AAC.1
MSASLVGSEMCIRDSTRPVVRALSGAAPVLRPAQPGGVKRAPSAPSWSSVSYTHLTLPTICSV